MSHPVDRHDLAAAVAAGIVTERQAAALASFAETRAGLRTRMPQEDEPFELFRGLNEIFVATGLVLLIAGAVLATTALGGTMGAIGVAGASLAWALAEYFTRRRRMVLPSIVLAGGLSIFALMVAGSLLVDEAGTLVEVFETATLAVAAASLAALAFYARFRLPFSLFLAGLLSTAPIFTWTGALGGPLEAALVFEDPARLFDLGQAGRLAVATLLFGLAAFALAMGFDTRDPYRVGRLSRCGFWLHLLAAPAIVNTLALSLYRLGTGPAIAALTAVILAMVVVALVIDRRSFLLSAAAYLGLVLGLAFEETRGEIAIPAVLLLLGTAVTGLGAGWTSLRTRLMRALPPGRWKAYLPPYADTPRSAP